jgi:hypothetical protein
MRETELKIAIALVMVLGIWSRAAAHFEGPTWAYYDSFPGIDGVQIEHTNDNISGINDFGDITTPGGLQVHYHTADGPGTDSDDYINSGDPILELSVSGQSTNSEVVGALVSGAYDCQWVPETTKNESEYLQQWIAVGVAGYVQKGDTVYVSLSGNGSIVGGASNFAIFTEPGPFHLNLFKTEKGPADQGREISNIVTMNIAIARDPTNTDPSSVMMIPNAGVGSNGSVSLIDGDYNRDGVVNIADYTVWRDTLGSTTDLRANGDDTGSSTGKIDQADFIIWETNFGIHAGSGASDSVPEPSTTALLVIGCVVALVVRRR